MSTNLFWRPKGSGECLSKEMKSILTSAGLLKNGPDKLTYEDTPMLMAIRAASNDTEIQNECSSLIGAIDKYEEIEIFIE